MASNSLFPLASHLQELQHHTATPRSSGWCHSPSQMPLEPLQLPRHARAVVLATASMQTRLLEGNQRHMTSTALCMRSAGNIQPGLHCALDMFLQLTDLMLALASKISPAFQAASFCYCLTCLVVVDMAAASPLLQARVHPRSCQHARWREVGVRHLPAAHSYVRPQRVALHEPVRHQLPLGPALPAVRGEHQRLAPSAAGLGAGHGLTAAPVPHQDAQC